MAYFDTGKTAGTSQITSGFYRLVKSLIARLSRATATQTKSPEDIIAAQHRAEAHRRAVDTLMR